VPLLDKDAQQNSLKEGRLPPSEKALRVSTKEGGGKEVGSPRGKKLYIWGGWYLLTLTENGSFMG